MNTTTDPIISLKTRLDGMELKAPRTYADWRTRQQIEDRMLAKHATVFGMLMVEMSDAGVGFVGSEPINLPDDVARDAERRYRKLLVDEVEARQPRRYSPRQRLPRAY